MSTTPSPTSLLPFSKGMETSTSNSSISHPMEANSPIPIPFRCPISMELMLDPVTVSTGVTYDRPNIESWLFTYKKRTCPATMQRLTSLDLTPNLTLRRLIAAWPSSSNTSTSPLATHKDKPNITDLLHQIETAPFKLSPLRRLRGFVEADVEAREELVKCGGVEVLGGVVFEVLEESGGFEVLEACKEAVGVLQLLPLRGEREMRFLMRKESLGSMVFLMQRGSAEARLHVVVILQKMVRTCRDLSREMGEQGIEFYKSLLEILSDEISTHASAAALDVMIEMLTTSKRSSPARAVEAGAVCLAIELLPDASKHRCEKLLLLLRLLCKCPEGRAAFADHALGVAAVSKKIMRVSEVATKLAVKVLWHVCSALPAHRVLLEEMIVVGAVKKMLALLHVGGRSSTKELVIRVIRLHGQVWQQYPCFPRELKDYLRMVNTNNINTPSSATATSFNSLRAF